MHVFQRFLISLRNLHQGAALASSVSGMWKDTSLMIERERIYEWCQSTETSCRITSDLGYRKHFLIVEKGRTFGRKWKHTFGSQSPTFEKKNPQNLKKKIPFCCVLTECVLFQCMDHLETWGVTLFSSWGSRQLALFHGLYKSFMPSWFFLSDLSAVYLPVAVSWVRHYALLNKKGLKGKALIS